MRISSLFITLLIILIGIGTIFPLFNRGFFDFHDRTQIVRVSQMSKSLEEGMFPVRWVDGLGYGYGYPIFNFYGPFPYYVGGVTNLIGIDSLTSTKIMIGFGMLASGVTMFYFSRKFFGFYGGLFSSILYFYFPYHAVNLYVRGAIGELYAYAFLPLVFLGLFSLLKLSKTSEILKKPLLLLALPMGIFLTATSHNLSLLMGLLIIFFAITIGAFVSKSKKSFFISSFILILLGLLLSSFYIIPAFLEMNYTNVSSQVGGGADFRDHFVCLSQLWDSQWGYGGSTNGCLDGLSFKLGKIHLLALGMSVVFLFLSFFKKKIGFNEKIALISLILFLISIFMLLPVSEFIYAMPYLEYIQYPWRFLNFAGLFLSFLAGYIFYYFRKASTSKKLVLFLAGVLLIIAFNFNYFKPQNYVGFDSKYYNEKEYISYTASKISDEYMPKDFDKPTSPSEIPVERFSLIDTPGFVRLIEDSVNRKTVFYDIETDGLIHANLAYFPAWMAYVDGREVLIVQKDDGVNIELEKGIGEVTLQFRSTFIEALGNVISILALIVLLTAIIFSKSYGKKTS